MIEKAIISILITWLITRIIKLIIELKREHKFNKKMLFIDGSMPSSHAAWVFGLTSTIYQIEGATTLFLASLVISLVICYDAMKVRWFVGLHARELNRISKQKTKFEERVGHTPLEVVIGSIIGIITPIIIYTFF